MIISFILAAAFSLAAYLATSLIVYAFVQTAGASPIAVTVIYSLLYPALFALFYLLAQHVVSSKGYRAVARDYPDGGYSLRRELRSIIRSERGFFILVFAASAFCWVTMLADCVFFGGKENVISYLSVPFIALTLLPSAFSQPFPVPTEAQLSLFPFYMLSALTVCVLYLPMLLFARRRWYGKHMEFHKKK